MDKSNNKLKDKIPFEIKLRKNGLAYVDLDDETVFNLIKLFASNDNLVKTHYKELVDVFEDELYAYAENRYNEFGEGEFFEDCAKGEKK